MLIADAVFPQLESLLAAGDAKPRKHFQLELYPPHIAESPITVLPRLRYETGRLNDFHRCVLDMDYRAQLIEESRK